MAATKGKTSRSGYVHEQLRGAIIAGSYEPGSPLRLAELAARFDVSMSVVREALVRLSEQNLVSLTPNQGFRVVEISRDDLIDVTNLRVTLETLALRESIERGGVEWEAEVIAAHHVLERADLNADGSIGTTEEWSSAHTRFHHALGAACGSPRLTGIIDTLRDSSEIYRQLSARSELSAGRDIAREHRELMELATRRKTDEASTALERHLRRTTDMLLESAVGRELPGA